MGEKKQDEQFFPVSTLTIIPGTTGQFDLYLKRYDNYVLYCNKGDVFSDEKMAKVLEVAAFFVHRDERLEYERYLAKNLGDLLMNETIPMKQRAKIFYNISRTVVNQVFEQKVPRPFSKEAFQRMLDVVNASIAFFAKEGTLESFSQFISHDYHTYSHSVQTMVLMLSVMHTRRDLEKSFLKHCAMGALLHDIGKVMVPVDILGKHPNELSVREWDVLKTHPIKGLRMCENVDLPKVSMNCILFHHEREDGTGYPGGLGSAEIPQEVKLLSVCNIYDVLTSQHSYTKAMKPFDALAYMRENMKETVDQESFKRLVFVLGNANIT